MHLASTRLMLALGALTLASEIRALTFDQWRTAVFSSTQLADAQVSGALADPDADGFANLAEYFFAGDPLLSDVLAPQVGLVADHLTLSYREQEGQTGVTPFLKTTHELASGHWITYNTLPEVDREQFTGHDLVTVTDPVALDTSRRFLRLELKSSPANPTLLAPTLPAIDLKAPRDWMIGWNDPNIAESSHAIERQLSSGTWQRVGVISKDRIQWLHSDVDFYESLTYRIVAVSASGVEKASEPVSLPDTDDDGIPDALEAGSPFTAFAEFASYFDQWDSDGDLLPDGWEARNGLDPMNPNDASEDSDGDGVSNAQEYAGGSNPKDYYNGQPAVLTFVSGHQQSPTAGEYYAEPVVVRVTRPNGTVLVNAPITFNVSGDAPGGGLADASGSSEPVQTKLVRTNASGLAQIYWKVVAP